MAEQLEVDVFGLSQSLVLSCDAALARWQERYLLKVNLRVVYPIAIRTPSSLIGSRSGSIWSRCAPSRGIPQSSFVFPSLIPSFTSGRRRAQARPRTTLYPRLSWLGVLAGNGCRIEFRMRSPH